MVSIRTAKATDTAIVAPLFDAYRQFYGCRSDPALAQSFIGERLEKNESVILLAEDGGGALGFVQLFPSFTSHGAARVWILNDLFVAPTGRRQGVASTLLRAAADFAKESGAVRLQLVTAQDNRPAQALYEKLGWQHDATFRTYLLAC